MDDDDKESCSQKAVYGGGNSASVLDTAAHVLLFVVIHFFKGIFFRIKLQFSDQFQCCPEEQQLFQQWLCQPQA